MSSTEKNRQYKQAYARRHPDRVRRFRNANRRSTQGGPNSGKEWTSAEMKLVLEFDGTDRELAAKLGRSVEAIQLKRMRIGGRPT